MITIKLRPGQDPIRAIQKMKSLLIIEDLFADLKRKRYFIKPCIAKRLKSKEAERKKKIQPRRVYANTEKCETCIEFIFAGSNQHYKKSTCLRCGAITREPKAPMRVATEDPSTCLHMRTNFQGSSKQTHRVHCLDCDTCVSEEPQEEYKDRKRRGLSKEDTPSDDRNPVLAQAENMCPQAKKIHPSMKTRSIF